MDNTAFPLSPPARPRSVFFKPNAPSQKRRIMPTRNRPYHSVKSRFASTVGPEQAEKLALLHGGAARDYQAAATDFAHAARLKAGKNWSAALEAEIIAWQKLRLYLDSHSSKLLDQLPVLPSAGSSRSSQL